MLPAVSGIEQFLTATGWAVRLGLNSLLFRRGRRRHDVDLLHVLSLPVVDDVEDGVGDVLRL